MRWLAVGLLVACSCKKPGGKEPAAPAAPHVTCRDDSDLSPSRTYLAMICDLAGDPSGDLALYELIPERRHVLEVAEGGTSTRMLPLASVNPANREVELVLSRSGRASAPVRIPIPLGALFTAEARSRDGVIDVAVDTCDSCAVEIAGERIEARGGRATRQVRFEDLAPADLGDQSSLALALPFVLIAPDGRRIQAGVTATVDADVLARLRDSLLTVDKKPLAWAAERAATGPRPAVVFFAPDKNSTGPGKLGAMNGLTRLRDAQVVVIRRDRSSSTSCPTSYVDGSGNYTFGMRFSYSTSLTAFDARTGKKLAATTVRGKPPGPCPRKVTTMLGHVVVRGDSPDEKKIEAWIAAL